MPAPILPRPIYPTFMMFPSWPSLFSLRAFLVRKPYSTRLCGKNSKSVRTTSRCHFPAETCNTIRLRMCPRSRRACALAACARGKPRGNWYAEPGLVHSSFQACEITRAGHVRVELVNPSNGEPLEIVDSNGKTIRAKVVVRKLHPQDYLRRVSLSGGRSRLLKDDDPRNLVRFLAPDAYSVHLPQNLGDGVGSGD